MLAIFSFILINFALVNGSKGEGYIVRQITSGSTNHRWPSINNNGNIVWAEQIGSYWQVVKDAVQITSDSYDKRYPAISDSGDIVYVKYGVGGGVQRYVIKHPSTVVEISTQLGCQHRDAAEHPDISLAGEIIWYYDWYGSCGAIPDGRRLNSSVRGRIVDNLYPGDYPSILSSTGEYVWQEEDLWGKYVYSSLDGHIDSGEIPRISEYGIVYISRGYIKLHREGHSSYVEDEDGYRIRASYADINDNGEIVFERQVGGVYHIFLGTITPTPVAVIDGPTELIVDSVGNFDGFRSYDQDNSGCCITSWEWTFETPGGGQDTATGQMVMYRWNEKGEYEVSLTVTDDEGLTNTTFMTVAIGPRVEIVDVRVIPLVNPRPRPIEMGERYNLNVRVMEKDTSVSQAHVVVSVVEHFDPATPVMTQPLGDWVYGWWAEGKNVTPGVPEDYLFPLSGTYYWHSWDWLNELNLGCIRNFENLLFDVLGGWIGHIMFSEIMNLVATGNITIYQAALLATERFISNGLLVPEGRYLYEIEASDAYDASNKIFTTSVHVPQYKIDALNFYWDATIHQSVWTGLGFLASPLLFAVEALALGSACFSYHLAADPDPNFTETVKLEPISVPSLDTLPDSAGKRLARDWLEVIEAQKATGTSLGRYEGAKEAGDQKWMFIQLQAAREFHEILMDRLLEVQDATGAAIAELEAQGHDLTQADIENAQAQLVNEGLPQLERDILMALGFSSGDIAVAGQVTAGLLDFLPTDWQGILTDGVQGIVEIQRETGDWINERLLSLNEPPEADAGSDEIASAGDDCLGTLSLDGTGSSDPDGDALTFTWTGPFGTASGPTPEVILGLGTHTISLTVYDGRGGTDSDEVAITVEDTTAPIPDVDPLQEMRGECSASISSMPTATDNCAGTVIGVTSDPTSYTEQGTYTVTWTYEDGNGNVAMQIQNVIVQDVTPPVPDVDPLPKVRGECSARITLDPTATDNCVGALSGTTLDPREYIEQGTYTVNWTFDDGYGNTTTQTQEVIVKDTTPPTIGNLVASPNALWPPNHKMALVTVEGSVLDNCDEVPTCHISSVSSDEPEDGLGDGDTSPDWEITGDLTVNLRAERSGAGDGRVYTLGVACDDFAGNSATGIVDVTVSHDRGEKK